jgi:hypothetical protein
MNNNGLERWRAGSISEDARAIEAALERIRKADAKETETKIGRLIFALDLAASRESSVRKARRATSAMFETLREIGASITVKLVYFRGRECRATGWRDDPGVLVSAMEKLDCRPGQTQIAKVLRLVLNEKERLSAIVLIGDACEDDPEELKELAEALGEKKIPLFVFHDHDGRDQEDVEAAVPVFQDMAAASGGAYCPFGSESAEALRELLASVAVFSAAGAEGVSRIPQAQTPEARQLQGRLLLLGPASEK